jgi:CubicO group peptidase (beta-lactamase class C family)
MKTNFRVSSFLTLFMILLWTTTPALANPASSDLQEKVDTYIAETMHRFPIPGMAVGIVKDDQILYLKGYGIANTRGDPVTPQTLFPLQSVTKTFTALAIHQLANTGKIDLDEPVQTYIPEFRLADQSASTSIMVRQLLDHTSGISKTEGEQIYLQSRKSTFDEALAKLVRFKPHYKPGEHYEYSNWNYALLGELIRRVSGQPYIDYVQQNIFAPLDMAHAGFGEDDALAGGVTGNVIVFGFPMPYDEKYLPAMDGAANLCASAEEMTHYLIPYLNQGQYLRHNLLDSGERGWYDITWNWHAGIASNSLSNSFSGSHNATQAIPGPGAWNIAENIADMTMDHPYEIPSNRSFYFGYALLDGFLLLLIVSIFWQAFKLNGWANQYKNTSRSRQITAWLVIVLDLLICAAILVLPSMANSSWSVLLFHRPDFSIPLLVISVSLGLLGLTKIIKTRIATGTNVGGL